MLVVIDISGQGVEYRRRGGSLSRAQAVEQVFGELRELLGVDAARPRGRRQRRAEQRAVLENEARRAQRRRFHRVRIAGIDPVENQRKLDPGEPAQVEFEPVQRHCPPLGIHPVIELKIRRDGVFAGQLSQIESIERFRVDRDALDAQFGEIRRLVASIGGEIEIVDRNPVDMDRLGLDALGRLGRRLTVTPSRTKPLSPSPLPLS